MLGPVQREGVPFSLGKRLAPELHSIIKKCRHWSHFLKTNFRELQGFPHQILKPVLSAQK